jgi:hypothetical protein
MLATGCARSGAVPTRLFDGSRSLAPPTKLEGVDGPAILTRVRVRRVADVEPRSSAASCLRRDWGTSPNGVIVERAGVSGESVTFANASESELLGCDNSGGPREDDRRWCGVAAGQLHAGHLRDPRLDVGCSTEHGDPMGFVWVEPARAARYVAVEQPGYAEVYEVTGGLPVRISTTSGVDDEPLRARFAVSEYSNDGRRLHEYEVDAVPAG